MLARVPSIIEFHIIYIFLKSSKLCLYLLTNGYYMTCKLIPLLCVSIMFIKMKFIYCYSCIMFVLKSMSVCFYIESEDEVF